MNESDRTGYEPPPPPEQASDYNPYAPPDAMVADVVSDDDDGYVQASRGSRLGARILDALLILVALLPLVLFVPGDGDEDAAALFALGLLALMLAIVVVQIVLLIKFGQTVGKKIMKIKIVRMDNSRASGGRLIFMRDLLMRVLSAVPIVGPIFSLANVLFIFREDQRCIHDHIADTKVVVVPFEIT